MTKVLSEIKRKDNGKWIKMYNNPNDGNYYCTECHHSIDIATGRKTPIARKFFLLPLLRRKNGGWRMNIQLGEQALMPVRAHDTDAGLDLLSPMETVIPAHGAVTVDTGVHIELPQNTAGFLKSKSGLNVKHGITSEGVIDVGYTGSIAVKLYNHSGIDYTVRRGDKISQLVVVKIATPELALVEKLADTERGNGGFGSTGR